jgi:hypothetical protein
VSATFQQNFHGRWRKLHDPHVRALAWLLQAPALLDPHASQWQGKLASLQDSLPPDLDAWLHSLDRAPAPLHDSLDIHPYTRLGRYAEQLMAFYFSAQHMLVAHGVQVRTDDNQTIGEFDFLLKIGDQLVHWEFATKFYLLKPDSSASHADYFVGPNLADSLGAKMQKIFGRQLLLSQHPAARIHLPQPVAKAQALVRGWLFYRDAFHYEQASGTSAAHCHGFWCALSEAGKLQAQRYAILPRLQWLAPAQLAITETMDQAALQQQLNTHFAQDGMPVMIALLRQDGTEALETERGFIVPNDWSQRAGQQKTWQKT